MRDRLRAVNYPKEIIYQFNGWSSGDVGKSYSEGFSLNILSDWLSIPPITDATYYLSCRMTMAQINNMKTEKVLFSNFK